MKEKLYTIYKATNKINGKAYVGFDSNWPSRKSVHICEAITRKNKKYPFYRALRKYGIENFEWEILHQSADKNHTLSVVENQMIIEHKTHYISGYGYNLTFGGEGAPGWIPSEETKRKIGIANSRSTLTEEGRRKKSEFTRKNNPMSRDDVKKKHRQKLLEIKTNAKKVQKNGKIYDSIRDANKDYPEVKYQTLYYWVRKNMNGWSYVDTKYYEQLRK